MTVVELIEILKALPPEMEVRSAIPFDPEGPERWDEPRVTRSVKSYDRATSDGVPDVPEYVRIGADW